MQIKRKATIVYCRDINVSKRFYLDLGFKIELDLTSVVFFEEGVAIWQLKPGHILQEKIGEELLAAAGNKFELYFELADWENFVTELRKLQIDYVHDVHEEPWGQKTIRFYDPDENIIEIAETLETFIKRMYESGVSIGEIARRNEVSIVEIEKVLQLN